MLKTKRFFNTFQEHVAVYYISASEFVINQLTSRSAVFAITRFKIYIIEIARFNYRLGNNK